MADVHSAERRSFNMSQVRNKGNKSTELKIIGLFKSNGITGWRRNTKVFGHPDFIFRPSRVALFIDGCFWHGCPRGCKPAPAQNEFWCRKIARNKQRDRVVNKELRSRGWTVVRIWEHDLRKRPRQVVIRISKLILAGFKEVKRTRG